MMTPENDEVQTSWAKIERNFRKAGLRNGLSDGRDANFQNSFDEGFYEGFRNGYVIALYKGVVFTQATLKDSLSLQEHQLLSDPRKGWCQTCLHFGAVSESTSKIVKDQTKLSNENVHVLHNLYSKKCSVNLHLPNKLECDY